MQSSDETQDFQSSNYVPPLNQNEVVGRYVCSLCYVSFKCMWELLQHKKVMHSSTPIAKITSDSNIKKKFHTCEFCSYKSFFKSDVTRHRRTHTGERPFKCQFCPYSGTVQCSLDRHMNLHSCGFCNYISGDKQDLQLHRESHQINQH